MADRQDDQRAKALQFVELHKAPGAFVMPNPWDAGSARILSALGFAALATTSAGLAFSLGRRDSEGAVSREETLANAQVIAAAAPLPVSAALGGFLRAAHEIRDRGSFGFVETNPPFADANRFMAATQRRSGSSALR